MENYAYGAVWFGIFFNRIVRPIRRDVGFGDANRHTLGLAVNERDATAIIGLLPNSPG